MAELKPPTDHRHVEMWAIATGVKHLSLHMILEAHDPVILVPSKRLKGSFLTRKRPVKKETARNDGSWIHHLRQICTNIAQTPMSMCIRHAKIRLRTPALIQCSSASAGKMCLAA